MRPLIVVFGAAVRKGGRPSPALRRRIDYAARAAARHPNADLFLSGAIGRHGPSEAEVMATTLKHRIGTQRIHLDEKSVDTLQSVRNAATFARTHGYSEVLACTDRYHQPRVRMLFALFGVRARSILFTRTETPGSRLWLHMHLREAAALPYDLVAGLWVRRTR